MKDVIALPAFAPLNSKMVLYLLRTTAADFLDLWASSKTELLERLGHLEALVQDVRMQLFDEMLEGPRSVEWLRSQVTLPPKKARTTGVTRATWNNYLRTSKQEWGRPDLERSAGIILSSRIIRLLPPAQANKFESPIPNQEPNEEILWCWRQAPPQPDGRLSPLIPCPWPELPSKLEPGTLLLSNWGLFDSSWTQWPGIGAVRFTTLDENSLERWDPSLKADEIKNMLNKMRQHVDAAKFEYIRLQTLQQFAQSLLGKLALSHLSFLPSIKDNYPLVWKPNVIWPQEVSANIA